MPVFKAPGVYVIEEERGPKSIEGVSTSTAAFIGVCRDGPPFEPKFVDSFDKFESTFGGIISPEDPLGYAVRGFFDNGGQECYVVRTGTAARSKLDVTNESGKTIFTLESKAYGKTTEDMKATLTKDDQDSLTTKPAGLAWMHPGAVPVTEVNGYTVTVRYDPALAFRFADDEPVTYDSGATPPNPQDTTITDVAELVEYDVKLDTTGDLSQVQNDAVLKMVFAVKDVDTASKTMTVTYEAGSKFRFAKDDSVTYDDDTPPGDPVTTTIEKITKVPGTDYDFKVELELDDPIAAAGDSPTLRLTDQPEVVAVDDDAKTVTVRYLDPTASFPYAVGDPVTYDDGAGNEAEGEISSVTPVSKAQVTLAAAPDSIGNGATLQLKTPRVKGVKDQFITVEYSGYSEFRFVEGDAVVYGDGSQTEERTIVSIKKVDDAFKLELNKAVIEVAGGTLRIRNVGAGAVRLRVDNALSFYPGSVLKFYDKGDSGAEHYDLVVDKTDKFLTLARGIPDTFAEIDLTGNPNVGITSREFSLELEMGTTREQFRNLGLFPGHPNYFVDAFKGSGLVTLELPEAGAPKADDVRPGTNVEYLLPKPVNPSGNFTGGADDDFGADKIATLSTRMDEVTDALERKRDVSIVAFPGITDAGILAMIIGHCEKMKYRFAILDGPKLSNGKPADPDKALEIRAKIGSDSGHAAYYYPWLEARDDVTGKKIKIPPSGHVAGIYARTDNKRGVHKAPANEKIRNIVGLTYTISFAENGRLNPEGVNCLRAFPGRGNLVWGARTISKNPSWKYVNVRRLFIFLEDSIERGTHWVVFEPNDEKLWARVKQTIINFLTTVWRDGALMGTTAEEAFFVRCDRTTMTQDDIDNGRLICVIGVAPVKPAEFVIFKIAQWTAGSEVT
jgi:hypothetical protein